MNNKLDIQNIKDGLRDKSIYFYDEYALSNGTRLSIGYKSTLEGWSIFHKTLNGTETYYLSYITEGSVDGKIRSITENDFKECQQLCYDQMKG